MNWTYLAVLAAILLVVFFLVRWVVMAQRRWGRLAAWLVIVLEAVGVGLIIAMVARTFPDLVATWVGEQILLAIIGIGLAIFVGGGLVMALGRR